MPKDSVPQKCSHCGKGMSADEIAFYFHQQTTKDTEREVTMCPHCTNHMLKNMVCWNSDLANKIFNYINIVPAP